jgi:Na+/H+-translocating membrane pyrophosphatase
MIQIAMRPSAAAVPHQRTVTFRPGGPGTALFASSWLLVTILGLMPIAEAMLHRTPSVPRLAVIAFFVAVGSAAVLRRRYTWLGVVLHIYSQIAIWLSVTFCSMAFVMSAISE